MSSANQIDLPTIYADLHAHPELSFQETRTAGIVSEHLEAAGYSVTPGVGKTGVVGVLERGEGPTVMLRADMDALPVKELTGLDYASTQTATLPDGTTTPVMHACGHDLHTTCLIGAASALAADTSWQGKLIVVFQPAEEVGKGARAMVTDGLFERFGRPSIVLGQHVSPLPTGSIGIRPGPAFAASDSLKVTLFGQGGHGSRPETTVDPVVMASMLVVHLQTIVSREVAGGDTAVVTVGSLHAGTAGNIIPDEAELKLSVRTFDPHVRDVILNRIERITNAEAQAAGAQKEPSIELVESFPAVVNAPEAAAELQAAFQKALPEVMIVDPGTVTGSEDIGILAQEAGAQCMYWLLGGADADQFQGATSVDEITRRVAEQPSNHSPFYAPVQQPTIQIGTEALVAAAKTWLA